MLPKFSDVAPAFPLSIGKGVRVLIPLALVKSKRRRSLAALFANWGRPGSGLKLAGKGSSLALLILSTTGRRGAVCPGLSMFIASPYRLIR